jgi:hypothetical protein
MSGLSGAVGPTTAAGTVLRSINQEVYEMWEPEDPKI